MGEEEKIIAGPRIYGHKGNRGVAAPFTPSLKRSNRWGRWLSTCLALSCLAAAVGWSWIKYQNIAVLPIQTVKIDGEYAHVDQELLQQTILPFASRGLLTIDARSLQDRLQQLPWVNTAVVHRRWPHTLGITLTEQKPIARFNNQALLSDQGVLFTVNAHEVPQGLPLFIALQGQQNLLLQNYLQMAPLLNSIGVKLSILTLDARQSWRLQLDNGIVLLLGRIDPLQRLQRFVTVYPKLIGDKAATVNYVDLRYANGVAVNFKNQT